MRLLCDGSGLVVANVGIKCGDKHEGFVEQLIDAGFVCNDALYTVLVE